MAEREGAAKALQGCQSERLDALGRLAGYVAHDFNNVLGMVRGLVELALEEPEGSARPRQALREIGALVTRAADVSGRLLAIGRGQLGVPQDLAVDDTLRELHATLQQTLGPERQLRLHLAAGEERIRMDPTHLEQVLVNLVRNARAATRPGGRVALLTTPVGEDPGGDPTQVRITVLDDGCGMDEATRARAFEPFFTTRAPEGGTGLGLASVYGVVKQAGGEAEITSAPHRGTQVHLEFPRLATQHPSRAVPAENPVSRIGRQRRILVVDDEAPLREITAKLLRRRGFECLLAASAEDALELLQRDQEPIDVLVTDVSMSGMSGIELARQVRARCPRMAVLVVSGYAAESVLQDGADPGWAVLQKPFTATRLAAKVFEALKLRPARLAA